jgi:hypothetical protein
LWKRRRDVPPPLQCFLHPLSRLHPLSTPFLLTGLSPFPASWPATQQGTTHPISVVGYCPPRGGLAPPQTHTCTCWWQTAWGLQGHPSHLSCGAHQSPGHLPTPGCSLQVHEEPLLWVHKPQSSEGVSLGWGHGCVLNPSSSSLSSLGIHVFSLLTRAGPLPSTCCCCEASPALCIQIVYLMYILGFGLPAHAALHLDLIVYAVSAVQRDPTDSRSTYALWALSNTEEFILSFLSLSSLPLSPSTSLSFFQHTHV